MSKLLRRRRTGDGSHHASRRSLPRPRVVQVDPLETERVEYRRPTGLPSIARRPVYLQPKRAEDGRRELARRVRARRRVALTKSLHSLLNQIKVMRPSRMMFCVRRKIRREVMFALGVGGKRGVGRGKSWNRGVDSTYSCGG